MPVQSNIGIQNPGTIAYNGTGTSGPAADIRGYVRFGWTFEVVGDLGTDAVFTIQSAPPSEEDNCVPGAFTDVQTIPICSDENFVAGDATVTIPADTPGGTICAVTIPCRPGAFVRLTIPVANAAVNAVLGRQGPR
jgi:hypothetical protein